MCRTTVNQLNQCLLNINWDVFFFSFFFFPNFQLIINCIDRYTRSGKLRHIINKTCLIHWCFEILYENMIKWNVSQCLCPAGVNLSEFSLFRHQQFYWHGSRTKCLQFCGPWKWTSKSFLLFFFFLPYGFYRNIATSLSFEMFTIWFSICVTTAWLVYEL